jgi:hypothetical protein
MCSHILYFLKDLNNKQAAKTYVLSPEKYLKTKCSQLKDCANYKDNITFISGNTKKQNCLSKYS